MLTSSQVPLVYQNPLSHLVTSLPYIDKAPTDYMQKAQVLIKQEM